MADIFCNAPLIQGINWVKEGIQIEKERIIISYPDSFGENKVAAFAEGNENSVTAKDNCGIISQFCNNNFLVWSETHNHTGSDGILLFSEQDLMRKKEDPPPFISNIILKTTDGKTHKIKILKDKAYINVINTEGLFDEVNSLIDGNNEVKDKEKYNAAVLKIIEFLKGEDLIEYTIE